MTGSAEDGNAMTAATWTCQRCGVVAHFAHSEPADHPNGWANTELGWRCLGCRRSEAIEAAKPAGSGVRAATRRRALIEFELIRDPLAADREIARRVKCPTYLVVPVRAALHVDGRLSRK